MNNYFAGCGTLEELKKQYRNLAMANHPDKGGSEETMKSINNEYERVFELLKKKHNTDYAGSGLETDELFETYRDIIQNIINLEGIDIEICGTWIWVSGETYGCKDILKTNGFKWANNKKMWYWHPGEYSKKSKKTSTIENIRNTYGSEQVKKSSKSYIG